MKKILLSVLLGLMGLMGPMGLQAQGQCDTVRVFPWNNDFYSSFPCWEQLGDSSSLWQLNTDDNISFANAACITAPGETAANGCVLVSPALVLSADTAGLRLGFKTRRVGTAVQLRVLVSTGARTDLAGYDTLLSVTPSGYNSYEVNLAAYAGQTVYVAFSVVKPNPSYNMQFFAVGDVNIVSDRMPQGEWWMQNGSVLTGDTVEHEFYLINGIDMDSSAAFVWHSTMVEAGEATLVGVQTEMYVYTVTGLTLPRSVYRVVYHTPGTDTVTVAVSNLYGTVTAQSVSRVYDCQPIASFPAMLEYGHIALCGMAENFFPYASGATSHSFSDEDQGVYTTTDPYLRSNAQGYLVTPPIAVPADGDHLSLMLRYRYGDLEVRAHSAGSGLVDTALFTDVLFYESQNTSLLMTRKVSLAAYAGDTIRLAIIHKRGNLMMIMPDMNIDYDTLPYVHSLSLPTKVVTDSAILCTATLRYGAADGLHYTWTSALGGSFVTNALGDSAWVTYYTGGIDTITVTATNAYGSHSKSGTLQVVDCMPALTLPWVETFYDGSLCWWKPDSSNWNDAKPYSYYSGYYNDTHRALVSPYSESDEWVVSKAIAIPADAGFVTLLEWDEAAEMGDVSHQPHYSVLVSGDSTFHDLTAYDTLLTVSSGVASAEGSWQNWGHRIVSLASYAGQTVHVAFCSHPAYYGISSEKLLIDNVTVHSTNLPEITLAASADAYYLGDTALFTATAIAGTPSSYTWHSTLLDSTIVNNTPTMTVVYGNGGMDTVTVVATNANGSDTATVVVEVLNCSAPMLPFYEDFEGVAPTASDTLGELPNCWTLGYNGSNAAYGPHVITTGGYQYISNIPDNALLMLAGNSSGYGNSATVTLPRMADSLQRLALALDYRFENASYGTLTVGYKNAAGQFVAVQTLAGHAGSYRRDTVLFESVPLPDAQIMLRWQYNTLYYGVAIDNIAVFRDNSIHAPATVTVDSIRSGSAHVTWAAVGGASCYHLAVDGTAIDTTVSGLACSLTGLESNTQYTVQVAGIVAGDTGSYASAQFTTLCGTQPLPYYNDFSQGSASTTCWTSANLNQFFQNGYMNIYSGLLAKPSYQITPVLEHPAGQMVVSFRAKKYDASTQESGRLIVGVMTDPADTTTFTAIDTVMTTSSTWAEYRIGAQGLGTTPVAIAFCVGTGDGVYCDVIIDDLAIELPVACSQLLAAEATVIDARSAELSWQYDSISGLPAEGVLVTLHDLTAGDSTVFVAHGTDTLFSALPFAHSFRADLRVLCSGDTSEALSVSFTPEASACAEVTGSGGTNPVTSYPISGDKNYGYSQTLYPAVLAASVDTLYGIALRVGGSSDETRILDVYIGQTAANTITSPVSVATHTLAAHDYQYIPGTGWSRILFDTPVALDGVSNLIVTIDDNTGDWGNSVSHYAHQSTPGVMLYYNESFYSTVNVDPVVLGFNVSSTTNIPDIQLLGHCATDRCLQPVISLTPDTNAILVAWDQRGSESLWRVEYRLEGTASWYLADTTGATSYAIQGLNASSRYEVRVAAVCSDSNVVYSDVAVAATPCGAVTVPYHQSLMVNNLPCWNINGDHNSLCSSQWGFYLRHPLVSPAILGNLATMQVHVRVKGSPYFNPVVKVGVGDATGYGNVTWIDSMMFSTETPTDYTVYLSGYTGAENHIVLTTTNQNHVRLEDFVIEYVGCQPVHHVSVSRLSDTGAVLTWPPVADLGSWAVYLDGSLLAVVDTPYYALAALTPGTDYSVAVREICSPGDTAIAATVAFTTLCTELTLPWTEDFEGYPTSPMYATDVEVPCWHTILPAINISSHVSLVSINSLSNSHTLRFYDHRYVTQHDAGLFIYAASSPVNTAGHSATVEFDLRVERVPQSPNQPFTFQAGIMTDVTDTTTFIPMAVVTNPCDTHCLFLTDTLPLPDRFSVAFRFQGDITADVDNLSVTAITLPMHDLILAVNDTAMGSVSGGGTYEEGAMVTVTATPNPGYCFVVWSDSVTTPTRQIAIRDNDISLTAYFEPVPQYTVTVNAVMNDGSPYDGLDEMVHGAGIYMDGDTVTLEGEVHGCATSFVFWITAEGDTLSDNPYTFIIHSDVTLTAVFATFGGIGDVEGSVFRLYPNPASTTVTVEADKPAEVAILDVSGRQVMHTTVGAGTTTIDISRLAQGVYFVRFNGHGAVRKLVVR